MAGNRSNRGAFWLGAVVGGLFSASLAAALSLVSPLEIDRLAGAPAPAPQQEPAAPRSTAPLTTDFGAAPAEDAASPETQRSVTLAPAPAPETPPAPASETPLSVVGDDDPRPDPVPAPEAVADADFSTEPEDGATEQTELAPPEAPRETTTSLAPAPDAPDAGDTAAAAETPEDVVLGAASPAPDPAPEDDAVAPQEAADPPAPEDVEVAVLAPSDPAPAPSAVSPNALPPYKAYAEEYDGDVSQPLLAIVLTDVPDDPDVQDELLLLPGPLTIVVAPDAEAVEDLIFDIRDSGFEALLGLTIDALGDPSDEAATTSAIFAEMDAVDEVIGVAAFGAGLDEQDRAGGVVAAVEARGMALLDATVPGGGAGYRLAKAKNLPTAPNGRRFDDIQTSAMVFQALERAAFDARRTGAFVVIGEGNADVITGVRRWMNVKANKSVNVAPLSVVIEKMGRE